MFRIHLKHFNQLSVSAEYWVNITLLSKFSYKQNSFQAPADLKTTIKFFPTLEFKSTYFPSKNILKPPPADLKTAINFFPTLEFKSTYFPSKNILKPLQSNIVTIYLDKVKHFYMNIT